MPLCPSREKLAAVLAAGLDDPLEPQMESHLAECKLCQKTLLELANTVEEDWSYWQQLYRPVTRSNKKS